jgi:hypothetical protein
METNCPYQQNARGITQAEIIIEKIHNCKDCPIRKIAVKQPQSLFAKVHNWHKTWWPGWKAYQMKKSSLEGENYLKNKKESGHIFQISKLNQIL